MLRWPLSTDLGLVLLGVLVLSFFFQAEDGIRDIGVTGVQTCALPISTRITTVALGSPPRFRSGGRGGVRRKLLQFFDDGFLRPEADDLVSQFAAAEEKDRKSVV